VPQFNIRNSSAINRNLSRNSIIVGYTGIPIHTNIKDLWSEDQGYFAC
jgi:hypothetical protein